MKVTLFVRAPKKPEKRVVVERDVVIGRGEDCDLRVLSNDVSRKHCQLVIGQSEVAVRDLGSGNGTLINNQQIAPNVDARLTSGDMVQIGPLVIKVEFDGAAIEPAMLEPADSPERLEDLPAKTPTPDAADVVGEVEEVATDEADTDRFLAPADDEELLPYDDSDVDEFAETNVGTLEPDDAEVAEAAPVEQSSGKMKSLFGMFGKKNKAASENADPVPVDTKASEESDNTATEPLVVAGDAEIDEETVVFDRGNAFTPDEDSVEMLADDDEGLSDEGDYLDEEVEDKAVDTGFADFLNNVDQPPA